MEIANSSKPSSSFTGNLSGPLSPNPKAFIHHEGLDYIGNIAPASKRLKKTQLAGPEQLRNPKSSLNIGLNLIDSIQQQPMLSATNPTHEFEQLLHDSICLNEEIKTVKTEYEDLKKQSKNTAKSIGHTARQSEIWSGKLTSVTKKPIIRPAKINMRKKQWRPAKVSGVDILYDFKSGVARYDSMGG